MTKYYLISETFTEKKEAEWWDEQTDRATNINAFVSFENAEKAMRKMIKKLTENCGFFPMDNMIYRPVEEHGLYDDKMKKLNRIICKTVTTTDFTAKDFDNLDIHDTDDADHYFAFVANRDLILAYNDCSTESVLKMNVHNMDNEFKKYFFEYYEYGGREGKVLNGITVTLLSPESTADYREKDSSDKSAWSYKTMFFGRFMQDEKGKTLSPLSWIVFYKKDGKAMLISEKVIDYRQFSSSGSNDWKTSDLRTWLNNDFFSTAFNEEEKDRILETSGDRVFLLNKYYCCAMYEPRAKYTDYARKRTGKRNREPYGFFWTCEPSWEGLLFQVSNKGELDRFGRPNWSDGVRPAIWIKCDEYGKGMK